MARAGAFSARAPGGMDALGGGVGGRLSVRAGTRLVGARSEEFLHLPLFPGVQFEQGTPSRAHLQLLQHPLPLHQQH